MLRSMTGFARAQLNTEFGRLTVEIQSVNRKHLDLNIFLPRELSQFDTDIRKWITHAISRGSVTVKVYAHYEEKLPIDIKANLPIARQLKAAWQEVARDLGLKDEITLQLLASEPRIIEAETELQNVDLYRKALEAVIQTTLRDFILMREREGAELNRDIQTRLQSLQRAMETIASRSEGATDRYRQRLIERMNEVVPGKLENEERILREIVLYADRIDIAEELTRFRSHCMQIEGLLRKKEPIGKSLEFLIQELNREINTIGSKSSDIEISQLVIEVKTEIERIREQIQNVE